jgi:ATPase family AAA domain-containing protein 3A/B
LGDVVLDAKLETRVRSLATATANTRANGAPFRNVMLYGPPGTGKTMLAKRLARHSGLDYALMTGGDVAPLGADAVTRIPRTLRLGVHVAKGAFTVRRRGGCVSGETNGRLLRGQEPRLNRALVSSTNHPGGTRSALNALLYRTGELSRDVVLVIATNRPEDLDAAVLDRMDESMEFGLPDLEARKKLLKLYFDKLVVRGEDAGDDAPATGFLGALGIGKGGKRGGGKTGASIAVDADVDDAALDKAAAKMDGFSGREIAKTVAWRFGRGVRRLERVAHADAGDVYRGG